MYIYMYIRVYLYNLYMHLIINISRRPFRRSIPPPQRPLTSMLCYRWPPIWRWMMCFPRFEWEKNMGKSMGCGKNRWDKHQMIGIYDVYIGRNDRDS